MHACKCHYHSLNCAWIKKLMPHECLCTKNMVQGSASFLIGTLSEFLGRNWSWLDWSMVSTNTKWWTWDLCTHASTSPLIQTQLSGLLTILGTILLWVWANLASPFPQANTSHLWQWWWFMIFPCQPLLLSYGCLISKLWQPQLRIQCPMSNVQCPMSNVQCPMSNVQRPTSNVICKQMHQTVATLLKKLFLIQPPQIGCNDNWLVD